MPIKPRTCRKCTKNFVLMPGKPGNANDCPSCSREDVPLVMAKVSWEGKHCMILEITADRAEAERFNRAQARGGMGPLSAMCGSGEDKDGQEASKQRTGAGVGDLYRSRLNEKRRVK